MRSFFLVTVAVGILVALALTAACGKPKADPTQPAAPASAEATCPVCGGAFPRNRGVAAGAAGTAVTVCSQGCAIRHAVAQEPPQPRASTLPAPDDDEER